MNRTQRQTFIAIAAFSILAAGCSKKNIAAVPPPPPPLSTSHASVTPAAPASPATTVQPAAVAPRYPDAATRARINELLAKIEDAYFDYDKATLRSDALKALEADSTELRDILKDYPDYKLTIEGHCDERGSDEYNMALGDQRAHAAEQFLVTMGIPNSQLTLISYGKERPVCTDSSEACWQRNRRAHVTAAP